MNRRRYRAGRLETFQGTDHGCLPKVVRQSAGQLASHEERPQVCLWQGQRQHANLEAQEGLGVVRPEADWGAQLARRCTVGTVGNRAEDRPPGSTTTSSP